MTVVQPSSTGRAALILTAGTFTSRLTGFIRVLVIAYVLGVGSLSDAFNYANGVPSIIYDLLLGGVLSATLIPVFVEHLHVDDGAGDPSNPAGVTASVTAGEREDGPRAISAVLTAIAVALAVMTALLWLLAPYLIDAYLALNHSSTGPVERALATRLLHYLVLSVFFLGATVVTTALLNAQRHFTDAAFSQVVNNLIGIGALLGAKFAAGPILNSSTAGASTTLARFAADEKAVIILGLGTSAGLAIQFLIHLRAMHRFGLIFRPVWDLRSPAVRKVARLSTWLVGVVIANQVSLAVVMILAGKTNGGWTSYQFAYQFFQLPYALVAVSVASAIMPNLAERWRSRNRRGFERDLVIGLRITIALLIPMAFAYAIVAQPIILLALHHGAASASGAHAVSANLVMLAFGLPGFSVFFLLMRAYQAMQAARALFWLNALRTALSIVGAFALEPLLGVPGLSLAWVAPYTVFSIVAAIDLRRRIGGLGGVHALRSLWRNLVAGGISALGVLAVGPLFSGPATDGRLIARLVAQVAAGAAVYLVMVRVLRIRELRPIIRIAKSVIAR